jgi:peptidoglycan glycosyltransferase
MVQLTTSTNADSLFRRLAVTVTTEACTDLEERAPLRQSSPASAHTTEHSATGHSATGHSATGHSATGHRSLATYLRYATASICTAALLVTMHAAYGADSPSNPLEATSDMFLKNAAIARSVDVRRLDQMALEDRSRVRARDVRASQLDVVDLSGTSDGGLRLSRAPSFNGRIGDRHASITPRNNVVFYTLDPDLQDFVSRTVNQADAPHVAVVALNPKTGAILAIAGRSESIPSIEYHAGFPAASLFKVVTAAAAVEEAGIEPDSLIQFRGGTYTLNQNNYIPNPAIDHRVMSVGEALGRSCNPVFGHLGSTYLNGSILERYAQKFGFNRSLKFEVPMRSSSAQIPSQDRFELSRTSAGFGEVRISPIHAAALVAGIGNGGLLPRPYLIDRITDVDGVTLEKTEPEALQRIIQPETARSLLEMMRYTTTIGTSRREFMRGGRPALGDIEVAGKTGTLSGSNPAGLNNWFIGTAPLQNPELAVAVITVDASHSAKASRLGRLVMQRYFNIEPGPEIPEPPKRRITSKHKRFVKASHYRSKNLKAVKKKSFAKKKPVAKKSKSKKSKKSAKS